MKVKELIEKLQKCNQEKLVKVCSHHYPNEPMIGFNEFYNYANSNGYIATGCNTMSAYVDEVKDVWTIVFNDGSEPDEVYILDNGAYDNTTKKRMEIESK